MGSLLSGKMEFEERLSSGKVASGVVSIGDDKPKMHLPSPAATVPAAPLAASPPLTGVVGGSSSKLRLRLRRPSSSKRAKKTLSRRLNSVEAFFAWGAEVKGAFSIGLCVQLREERDAAAAAPPRPPLDAELLRAAAGEASLLDQPLARAVTVRAASFAPFAPPRVVLPAGAPPPEFRVLRREGEGHWQREIELACNRPFRSEEVALLDSDEEEGMAVPVTKIAAKKKKEKRTVLGQRACSFVLLLNDEDGDGDREEEDGAEGSGGGRRHELVVRFHHALFDGRAAVAFVGAVLRRYEAKVAARAEEAERTAAAAAAALAAAELASAAAAAAAAATGDGSSSDGAGAVTPGRALSPPSPSLSSSPMSPLARWPSVPSALGAFDECSRVGGDSGCPTPEPPSPLSPPPSSSSSSPPPSAAASASPRLFTSLPPSSSALSHRLGARAALTRAVASAMFVRSGLALARRGLGLRLPAGGAGGGAGGGAEAESGGGSKASGGGGGGGGEEAPPASSFSSEEERCAITTFALSEGDTAAFLLACRREGTSANSALAAATLASAAAVGEVSERSGGLSLQTHFDLRGHLGATATAAAAATRPSSRSRSSPSPPPPPPVGLCSFSEIKWFPREAFEAGGEGEDSSEAEGAGAGAGGGGRSATATSTGKLWEFARRYGRSVRAAARVPEGASFLERLGGPWRMTPPLSFRLQVVPFMLMETAAARKRGEAYSSVDVGLSNLGKVDLLNPDAAMTLVPHDASRAASLASSPSATAALLFPSSSSSSDGGGGGGEDAAAASSPSSLPSTSRSASPAPPPCSSSGPASHFPLPPAAAAALPSPPSPLSPPPASLAARGLFFVAGGHHLGPTLALNAVTAAGRLCLVAMTRNGGQWPAATSDGARERVVAELVRRVRAMAASAAALAPEA